MILRYTNLLVLLSILSLFQDYQVSALSSTTAKTKKNDLPTAGLSSSRSEQVAILDGSEWASIQNLLRQEKRFPKGTLGTKFGYASIVTGITSDEGFRVVAMKVEDDDSDDNVVYKDSIAVIPDKVSDEDAISTYITSLTTIQPTLPIVEDVGGSEDQVVGGTTVVLGSNDLACFAAEGLASLGVDVSLVSNGNPKVKTNVGKRKQFFTKKGLLFSPVCGLGKILANFISRIYIIIFFV